MRRPPLRLLRVANPVVRRILASPAHGLLSGSLLVLEYRGRRSGRTFRIPVMYARHGEEIVVIAVAPETKQWWRTFRTAAPARLSVAGRTLEVEGRRLLGVEARDAVRAYLRRFPRARGALGVDAGDASADLDVGAARAAVIAFRTPVAGER